jgi:hypothetical protein
MAQRDSGYARKRNDAYYTPEWVTRALIPYIPSRIKSVWEPAGGQGAIAAALLANGYDVELTDLSRGQDFFEQRHDVESVITNPPFKLANEFIARSLLMTQKKQGFVAMLLATDFDHAKGRRHLFGGCPQFAKKIVLTKRIVWFEPVIASPSSNHAWFCFDWRHRGPPVIKYYYENGEK